jgi:hypothetical protein
MNEFELHIHLLFLIWFFACPNRAPVQNIP